MHSCFTPGSLSVQPRLATRSLAPQAAPVAVPVAASASRPLSQTLADAVSARVGAGRFNLWFLGHAQFVPLGNSVVVAARNQHTQDWLEHTFGGAVKEAVAEVCGDKVAVKWVVDAEDDSDS